MTYYVAYICKCLAGIVTITLETRFPHWNWMGVIWLSLSHNEDQSSLYRHVNNNLSLANNK